MRKLLAVAALGILATVALATWVSSDAPVVHAAMPSVYNATGAEVAYSIPPGTTRLLIEARGGKGGNAGATGGPSCITGALGGVGHQVTTIYAVPPGTTQLFVNVGGNGTVTAGGFNGGGIGGDHGVITERGAGGGGGSDVRTAPGNPATRIVVAGGGGGAGGCGNASPSLGGAGGNAET